ncbi:MAG: type II secretion system protein [Candidatus Saccharimonadales bacterium]
MKLSKKQAGFTLVELLVATVVTGMMIIGIASLFLYVSSTQGRANRLLLATQAAENKIENFRNNHYNSLPLSPPAIDFTNELPPELGEPRSASAVISEPQTGLKRIEISVTWSEGSRDRTVELSTLISNIGIAQ